MRELEIWKFISEQLCQKEKVTLLAVAESNGSSPGRQGFKMVIAENDIFGSIGGGVMEVSLVKNAQSKTESPSKIIEQVHRKNSPNSSGMICSGSQTIIFKEITPKDLKIVKKIIEYLERQLPIALKITDKSLQILEMTQDNLTFLFQKQSENSFIYQEKLGFKQKLFIVGGGHCALALSEIMSRLDFYITVFDDRPSLNTLQKNSFANRINVIDSYQKIGELIESDANSYVVVMTLGYKFDEIVIRQLFDKDFKYFGVLGSKAKMKTLLKSLEKESFDKNRLAKIHTPIGLPINSHTPEEIAISIAAEIISVKNSVK